MFSTVCCDMFAFDNFPLVYSIRVSFFFFSMRLRRPVPSCGPVLVVHLDVLPGSVRDLALPWGGGLSFQRGGEARQNPNCSGSTAEMKELHGARAERIIQEHSEGNTTTTPEDFIRTDNYDIE